MKLQNGLKKYDRTFFFCNDAKLFEAAFAQSSLLNNIRKKVRVYSCNGIRYSGRISLVTVSPEDEKIMLKIYRTYEFSDRFYVINSNELYGSLFHYMDTGVLTVEDVIKALLY